MENNIDGASGRKPRPRWVWLIGGAVGLCMGVSAIVDGVHQMTGSGFALPSCIDDKAAAEVQKLALQMPTLKSTDLKVVGLEQPQEVDASDQKRNCKGIVLLSDQTRHPVVYSYTKMSGSQYDAYAAILMVPPCNSDRAQTLALGLANSIDQLKSSGLKAVSLSEQRQDGGTEDHRICKAVLTLSDQSKHPFNYGFEMRADQIYGDVAIQ